MTQHTPGPWNIGTKNGARVWSENGETLIADANASESLRKEIKKANARLIAAAPDLLEALESAWLWMENQADGQSKGGHATFDLMMLREQRDLARAAIAKATGGQA